MGRYCFDVPHPMPRRMIYVKNIEKCDKNSCTPIDQAQQSVTLVYKNDDTHLKVKDERLNRNDHFSE